MLSAPQLCHWRNIVSNVSSLAVSRMHHMLVHARREPLPWGSKTAMACTKHASAFRVKQKEIAEIQSIVDLEETEALARGVSPDEAATQKAARKKQLTREKQEVRLARAKQRHAAMPDTDGTEAELQQQEPEESQGPASLKAQANAGASGSKSARVSAGGNKQSRKPAATPVKQTTYMLALDNAIKTILNHRIFKGILDADPMAISDDVAKQSGVQEPHNSRLLLSNVKLTIAVKFIMCRYQHGIFFRNLLTLRNLLSSRKLL